MKSGLEIIKALLRKQKLEKMKSTGVVRSKSWGGKPTAKKDRVSSKKNLRFYS